MKKKERDPGIRKMELFAFLFFLTLTIVAAWPFFTVTIEAGHSGAYFSRLLGGTVLGRYYPEGLHFVLPWDKLVPYDVRAQSKSYNVTALAKGGLEVNVQMSIIWRASSELVAELHAGMGPNYAENVIDPSVVSVVRSVIGSYEQSQLYDGSPLRLQEDVTSLLKETLVDAPFAVHSILIREVSLPDDMAKAISEKFVSEQNVLAQRYKVLEAVERYKQSYVDAEGERIAQSIVNDGMSEAYLRYLGIEATLELARSNNAKLVIIGDKDGLPLLLNSDMLSTSAVLPDGISPEEYIPQGEYGARVENFVERYDEIMRMLDDMDAMNAQVSQQFPAADDAIGEYTLPQESSVPTQTEEDGAQ